MGNEEELINCKCTFLVKFIDSYDVKEATTRERGLQNYFIAEFIGEKTS